MSGNKEGNVNMNVGAEGRDGFGVLREKCSGRTACVK